MLKTDLVGWQAPPFSKQTHGRLKPSPPSYPAASGPQWFKNAGIGYFGT